MNNIKFLKENVNTKYFDLPCNNFKSKLNSIKYHFNSFKISADTTGLFLCNKTSPMDYIFINDCFEGVYAILKDEIVQKIYNDDFPYEEQKEFWSNVSTMKNLMISIVVFPEKHKTVFGDFQKLPEKIIDFLLEFNMDIKFLNLIGTYFISPVWANETRICDCKLEHRFSINLKDQKMLSREDLYEKFNKYTPSSASVYATKIPVYIRSNKCAERLERILYACPHCNAFFSLYSEYNVVKCNNCGTAFEISRINSEIGLTRIFTSLDGAKTFQFNLLKTQNLIDDKRILEYQNLKFNDFKNTQKSVMQEAVLEIYNNKIVYKVEENSNTIYFSEILDVYLSDNNTIMINAIDFNKNQTYFISFKGEKTENLYILVDLFSLYEENN